jgi:hypothetical protein
VSLGLALTSWRIFHSLYFTALIPIHRHFVWKSFWPNEWHHQDYQGFHAYTSSIYRNSTKSLVLNCICVGYNQCTFPVYFLSKTPSLQFFLQFHSCHFFFVYLYVRFSIPWSKKACIFLCVVICWHHHRIRLLTLALFSLAPWMLLANRPLQYQRSHIALCSQITHWSTSPLRPPLQA